MARETQASELVPGEAMLRSDFFTVEPPRTMQADGYPWDHEIRVALPSSYADSWMSYPVLWVTDNQLETALSVLGRIDLIVVSVGASRAAGEDSLRRRGYDFYAAEDLTPPGLYGEAMRRDVLREREARGIYDRGGGAARFLDFLVDDVRPALASQYRMRGDDHALEGYSAGGWFVMYALFTRPGSFAKYIAGAPSLYYNQGLIWEIEEEFAATHDDLSAQLFFGIGDEEMTVDHQIGCLSSMARMVETLGFRRYPTLNMTVKIFPGESHATALPFVIGSAVQSLWSETAP
jgi:predicted alpha/beta superfamily hydrolase